MLRARGRVILVLAMSLVLGLTGASVAQPAEAGPSSWKPDPARFGVRVTTDVPVRMSDGRVLRAAIHEPTVTTTGGPARGPFPVLLWLTPYGKSASNPIDDALVQRGYLGVAVDVGGTGGSDGASQLFGPQEAADSVEIVDWVAALPHSNGRVGMSGGSYLAIDQMFAAAAVGPGSPLKAIFPIAVAADPYRDLFVSGGVVNLESPTGLIAGYAGVRTVTPLAERGSDPVDALRLVAEHGLQAVPFEGRTLLDTLLDGDRRYDGAYWSSRAPINVVDEIVANDVAVYLVGGDYDVFQRGEPLLYAGLQNAAAGRPVTGPMAAGQRVDPRFQLLFGPWHHGNQGQGADLLRLQLQWFDHWLKGRDTGITDTRSTLHVLEPGGARYDTATYPVAEAPPVRFNLAPGGKLTRSKPATGAPGDQLPFTGLGNNPCGLSVQQWSAGAIPADLCGPARRPADPLPTELAYTTDPLATNTTIAGPIGLSLFARATTAEAMWTVRLEDVAPDGSATELTAGALMGSLRALDPGRSWPSGDGGWLLPYTRLTKASRTAIVPGQRTRYDVEVRPMFGTIPAGHRLRLVIGTSDAPHLTPTPQEALQLIGGTYTIDHDPGRPSFLEVPVRR